MLDVFLCTYFARNYKQKYGTGKMINKPQSCLLIYSKFTPFRK